MKFRHFCRGRWRGSPCTKSLTFQYAFVWTLLPTWSRFKICNLKSLEEIQSEKTVFFSNYILFCFLILVRGSDGLHLAVSFTEEPNCFSLAFKLLPIGCAYQNAIELFNRIWAGKWKHLHSCSQLVLHISLVLIWSQVSRTVRSNEVEITKKYRKFDNTSFRGKRGQGLHELIPQLRTQKHILEADLISILLFKAVPKY